MTANDNKQNGHRKRGVRASRTKLVHALTEAGFRTQAALAEHIADREELDSAPKDLVNRAFRELPVDPQTLDRIAVALGVEVHTLYRSSGEQTAPAVETASSSAEPAIVPSSTDRFRALSPLIPLLLSVVALISGGWFYFESKRVASKVNETSSVPSQTEPVALSTPLSLGPTSLVVMPFENDPDSQVTAALRNALAEHFNVATPTAIAAAQTTDPQELAKKLRVDLVVFGDLATVGSLSGIRVYSQSDQGREQIWAESLPFNELPNQATLVASNIERAIRTAVDTDEAAAFYPRAATQDNYLQGQYYLEQPTSELNIKRAQSRFSSALRQNDQYAKAHAGLCIALLEEFWMGDEERAMNDAARTCGEALELAPEDSVVRIAHALFLRRSGRSDEAIEKLELIIKQQPHNAVALDGLASALLDSYRQSGKDEKLTRAIEVAQRSVAANPNTWRPYNTLLSLNWFAGNIPGAIEAAENSLKFEESELVLVNLGTMYLCSGQLDKSRMTYQRAITLAPESYIGTEFLGQAMYFLGDFERSANLRRTAIDSIADGDPEIHEMWGNLGDSFRQTGDTAGAIGAYLQATKIAERDHLRGNAAIADRASRAYYYTMLRTLDRDTVADDVYTNMLQELDEISQTVTETSALRRMAQTWLQLGETEKARDTLAKVIETCPGYGMMPDLAPLSVQLP